MYRDAMPRRYRDAAMPHLMPMPGEGDARAASAMPPMPMMPPMPTCRLKIQDKTPMPTLGDMPTIAQRYADADDALRRCRDAVPPMLMMRRDASAAMRHADVAEPERPFTPRCRA
jgi:hypothetical protein